MVLLGFKRLQLLNTLFQGHTLRVCDRAKWPLVAFDIDSIYITIHLTKYDNHL